MDKWQLIDTAPKDGTFIQAKIPGHGSDNIILWGEGFIDAAWETCGCWCFGSEQEPPDSWTDGICWESNEDNEQSVRPTHWVPLSETPQ